MEETEWFPSAVGDEFYYKHKTNKNDSWVKATLYGFYKDMLWIHAEGNTSPHTIKKSVFDFAQEKDMFIRHWLDHANEAIKHDMRLYGSVQSLETAARLFHAHHLLKLPEE